MENYWEAEKPKVIETIGALIQWYPKAQCLCISQKAYTKWDGSLTKASHKNINIKTLAQGLRSQEEREHGAAIFSEVAAVFLASK